MPWIGHPKPLSRLKLLVVPRGKRRRKVVTGAFRGLSLEIDLTDQTQLFLGLHEREVYPTLRNLAPLVRSAIDIGAAEGEYTLFFLSRTSATKVIAVEPSEPLCLILQRNVAANQLDDGRLEVCTYAIGEHDTDLERRLDTVAASIEFPALIKIDVDGAEDSVLHGAETLLRRTDVYWVVETHSRALEDECTVLFKAHGLGTQIISNAWWRAIVPENRPIEHNRWLVAGPHIH